MTETAVQPPAPEKADAPPIPTGLGEELAKQITDQAAADQARAQTTELEGVRSELAKMAELTKAQQGRIAQYESAFKQIESDPEARAAAERLSGDAPQFDFKELAAQYFNGEAPEGGISAADAMTEFMGKASGDLMQQMGAVVARAVAPYRSLLGNDAFAAELGKAGVRGSEPTFQSFLERQLQDRDFAELRQVAPALAARMAAKAYEVDTKSQQANDIRASVTARAGQILERSGSGAGDGAVGTIPIKPGTNPQDVLALFQAGHKPVPAGQ